MKDWTQTVWRYSQHKTTSLLVLLAIAACADDAGICRDKSIEEIAERTGICERQTQRIIQKLEAAAEITVDRRTGRGLLPVFQITIKGDISSRKGDISSRKGDISSRKGDISSRKGDISDIANLTPPAPPIRNTKSLNTNDGIEAIPSATGDNAASPADDQPKEKQTSPALRMVAPDPPIEPATEKPKAARPRKSTADERTTHPMIQAIWQVTGRFPNKASYDFWINEFFVKQAKSEVDVDRMRRMHTVAFAICGWRDPNNFGWLTNWYVNGIPPDVQSKKSVDKNGNLLDLSDDKTEGTQNGQHQQKFTQNNSEPRNGQSPRTGTAATLANRDYSAFAGLDPIAAFKPKR